ncbi:TusE/DsrC/DsvC family sulfur relay protein [Shewanella glacialipiscicola]|uniref:Sulfurtransferase n=1 Tax=Shewanella glacialipiscicola TaxID=614069 RepID=A0ABQ6J3F9_9GAMM|nr:TusE/DsrC/DsvC family sulfur relay protein [Shewanella glacialipiscicola]MCL1084785.1 TusE/DsrC/DsvC family sulfur relay protein [Shewanella glacialipiscicola]MCU7995975.1 TusE/DsrC/DsvC family sulfur relay protein [Shewanella glacialipiscicola]MCU8027228.1 TusE/DsrC/DsvC family sulfur relay protein [Shewanella glacialipiscicola]GIU11374.1 sulfurtransferase [Shewanella glacialipiscicola]GMA82259.1 sulfurtransferase [Shewanella glacialipiscicola]
MVNSLLFNGVEIDRDYQGYLKNIDDWQPDMALLLAAEEQVTLTSAHWEVINFVRDFYLEYKTSPAIRVLVKAIGQTLGSDKGNSKYLYTLFPLGPAKQATKIAGLPKPAKCI